MASNSKGYSSGFNGMPGISREWEEIGAMFVSLLQKEMGGSLKAPTDFFSPGKIPLSGAEWEKVWKKAAGKIQETMMQNMKNFAFSPLPFQKPFAMGEDWEKFWEKVRKETHKTLDKHARKFGGASLNDAGEPVSDPETMARAIAGAMLKVLAKMEKFEALKSRYLQDFHEIFQSTITGVQETITKTFLDTEAPGKPLGESIGQDNLAFSSLQRLFLLNARFLKESMKI